MFKDNASLAALVGSRLCHDLISPIGAIQNGLELMTLAGDGGQGAEMTLIQDSCASAAARIRFFRVAFGSASTSQILPRRETLSVLTALARGGRVSTRWDIDADAPRAEAQLAYLAILCCETALPQGGEITVTRDATTWRIEGSGPRHAADADLWAHLTGAAPEAEITPASVQFALLARLVSDRGIPIEIDTTGPVRLTLG